MTSTRPEPLPEPGMVEVHSVCLPWGLAELYFGLLFSAPEPAVLQQQQKIPQDSELQGWTKADTESFLAIRHEWYIFVALLNNMSKIYAWASEDCQLCPHG